MATITDLEEEDSESCSSAVHERAAAEIKVGQQCNIFVRIV